MVNTTINKYYPTNYANTAAATSFQILANGLFTLAPSQTLNVISIGILTFVPSEAS